MVLHGCGAATVVHAKTAFVADQDGLARKPADGYLIPVSIEKSMCRNWPRCTRATPGSTGPLWITRTLYVAGVRVSRYVPFDAERVRATSCPAREKTIIAPGTGALHGNSAMQTGVIGPRVSSPYSPLLIVDP